MERSGNSADAAHALSSLFCYVGRFGDLGDPVLLTLKGVSEDVVTAYAYHSTKGRSLQSLALPRAGQNRCQKREMGVSTNNGLVNGPVHDLLMWFSSLGNTKNEVFEAYFFDTVIT